jgi:hypothetical protein
MSMPTVIPLFVRFAPPPPESEGAPLERPSVTTTFGYGICRSWNLCGCQGYRGDGTQTCQSCGHGFGAHY